MSVATRLFSIGQFSRITGLSVRTLRRYDSIGLLVPADVDEVTGYRYYARGQTARAEAIRRLRALEVPLEDVRAILDGGPKTARDRLIAHRAGLERRAADLRQTLGELTKLIDGKEPLVAEQDVVQFELEIRDVPEEQVLLIRDRVHLDEMSTIVPRAIAEVHGYMQELGIGFHGPPLCICPFAGEDGNLEAAVGWPIGEHDAPARGRIRPETLPATRALVMKYVGPFEMLGRSYRLLMDVMAENGLDATGDPREIYVTDPEEVTDPNEYETQIVWPIGPEGELRARDTFMRRVSV